ncbi:MAG: hypothetical protein ACERKX_06565 [Anaerolineales bacterium]
MLNYLAIVKFCMTVSCLSVFIASCQPSRSDDQQQLQSTVAGISDIATKQLLPQAEVLPASGDKQVLYGYTYHRADGNRLVGGMGDLPEQEPIDIRLGGIPAWIVSAPYEDGSVWVTVSEEGDVQAFLLKGREVVDVGIDSEVLPEMMPPSLKVDGGSINLLVGIPGITSNTTSPVETLWGSGELFIGKNGDLIYRDKKVVAFEELDLLRDGLILQNDEGQLLVLSEPTEQYPHGVLGDEFEAKSISFITLFPEFSSRRIGVQQPLVIEGRSAIWADVNEDGEDEIIVTASESQQGARLLIFGEDGALLAESTPIGQGFRWQHQIAVGPFGPHGEIELVSVRTPHIGGEVNYYRWEGDRLILVANIDGFSSHVIGSRNLDMAIAGDFDGDGVPEVLVPDQAMLNLAGLQRVDSGVEVDWVLPIGSKLRSNLSVAVLANGSVVLGAGRADGVLRLWPTDD